MLVTSVRIPARERGGGGVDSGSRSYYLKQQGDDGRDNNIEESTTTTISLISPRSGGDGASISSSKYDVQNKTYNHCCIDLAMLVLSILSVYALTKTSDEAVTNACGPELWNLLLARTVVGVLIASVLICFGVILAAMSSSPQLGVGIGFVVYSIVTLVFVVLEAVYASRAMQSSACLAALDTNHDNNGRMLPILLYVYMSIDCVTLFTLCAFCTSCLIGGGAMAALLKFDNIY